MRRKLLLLLSSSALTLSACNCGKAPGVVETSGNLLVPAEVLEFGPVTEFTQKVMTLPLENGGRGPLTLSVELEAGSSGEFTLGAAPVELAQGAQVELEITFAPIGPGEDEGAVIITSDEPDRAPVRVALHGGAIFPRLVFEEDPLAFAPAASSLVTKPAVLRNAGMSTLNITAIGVNPSGSPDFSITPPAFPLSLLPDASVPVSVSYARSLNTAEGLLQVVSDEPLDGGDRTLRLLPDPSRVCGDGVDNDNDGLTDFPDDPGCTSSEDGDEFNPPECVNGGSQPCGSTTGACRAGTRVCANSIWGACDGGVRPGTETCNGLDDDCNGMSDENLSELCTINGCSGARACVPNSGADGGLFTACIPLNSMTELCNGLDDNCNGSIDEGVVQTCTVFGCLGVRICVPGSDGGFTSCMPTNPLPESCNGADDDCNGQVDDVPDLVCGIGPCRRVSPACFDGGVSACLPGNPGTETCNGVDDDCNGTADDGVAPVSCGVGACAVSAPACLFDGGMNVCVPAPPTNELCNNIDDNCNGATDEQADGGVLRQSCYTGAVATRNVGRCTDGTANCVSSSGTYGVCTGDVLPAAETCNNIDDDCDGTPDNGLPNLTCGEGACFRSVAACVSGTPQICTEGSPSPETCNNIDDNCNGLVDDGFGNITCGVGACFRSVPACANGSPQACAGGSPTTETCNNIDDNCNGSTDEGLSRGCYSGSTATRGIGRCQDGTQTCTAGSWTSSCPGEVLPNATEICGNNIDDNCSGAVDEGCGAGCGFTPSTAADAQEANNSMGGANPRPNTAANSTNTYTYNITLPVGDTDWIRFTIPTSGSTTDARAEVLCINYGGAGCGATIPRVGLNLWYQDGFSGSQLDGTNDGTTGLAVVQNSGPIASFFAPQYWFIRAYPSSVVCTGEAINATVRVTVTNN